MNKDNLPFAALLTFLLCTPSFGRTLFELR